MSDNKPQSLANTKLDSSTFSTNFSSTSTSSANASSASTCRKSNRKKKQKVKSPLPMREGVSASRVKLPKVGDSKNSNEKHGEWKTVCDFLLAHFLFIPEAILKDRISGGHFVSQTGEVIRIDSPYQPDIYVFYYREIPDEPVIPFYETVLFKDDNIIVVDKPHFIPVMPTGRCVRECLLSRLKHRYQNEEISPIHRLDRETAGVMLYSCNAKTRGVYQQLFEKRLVNKCYEAIAPIAERKFPYTRRSHIMSSGDPFFIMREEPNNKVNSETVMSIVEIQGDLARYRLEPVTGRQHQLRVHMMSIGCPIVNDPFYPELLPSKESDYSNPLQLLAKTIRFIDPVTNEECFFESKIRLQVI